MGMLTTEECKALNKASRYDTRGLADAAIRHVCMRMNEWLVIGRIDRIDNMLGMAVPSKFSTKLAIGILTATLPLKDQLKNRPDFCDRVRDAMRWRREPSSNLPTELA